MHPPVVRRNPYLLPFLFSAIGLGLIGWYGQTWMDLPRYSDADIELSVEANLAMDLARLGPALKPDDAGVERLRAQIRAEVRADIEQELREAQGGVAAGLICLVLAAGHGLMRRLMDRAAG